MRPTSGGELYLSTKNGKVTAILVAAVHAWLAAGCTRISVDPTCPEDLAVGESFQLRANQTNEGAIATYSWSVTPSGSGTFTSANSPQTSFTPTEGGTLTVTLQASDGIFLATANCQVAVGAAAVSVSLSAQPRAPEPGDTVTLTCTSTGGTPPVTFTIDQLDGPVVALNVIAAGEATFTSGETGDYTFRCRGVDSGGSSSDPSVLDVTVSEGRPRR